MKTLFRQILPVLCLGLGAGFLNGVLGAGGGILVVAGLNALLGKKIEDKRAIFASAIAVMLPLCIEDERSACHILFASK